MTAEEELIYVKEELERYMQCLALCIELITGVCDGEITIKEMKNFRNNIENLGEQIQ